MQEGEEIKINNRVSIELDDEKFKIRLKGSELGEDVNRIITGSFINDGTWMLEDLLVAATRIRVLRDRPKVS